MNKLFLTLSLLALTAGSSHATLIAYEGFNYPQQTGLATQSGGTGWATTWDSSSWRTNSSGFGEISTGLTYSTLLTGGQAARNENEGNESFRQFGAQGAVGTYWTSFLIRKDSTFTNSFGISLFDGGTERNFMGTTTSGGSFLGVAGQGGHISSTAVTANQTEFFVARYDMDTQKAHFWLNPSLSGTPTDAIAFNSASGTSFTKFGFDRIRLGVFNNTGNAGSGNLDEFRIGTTFDDVAPVPEPSTWLGAGLLVGLVSWSQRKQFSKWCSRA